MMRTVLGLVVGIIVIIGIFLYLGYFKDIIVHKNTSDVELPRVATTLFEKGLAGIQFNHSDFEAIKKEIQKKIVGMDDFIHALIINIFAGGHLLVEGVPGLAKTKAIHAFSDVLHLDFSRIQFTPDMLPSDVVGVDIYNSKSKSFETQVGPIVANVVLADEINRTTPKVQSALLEAMQEKQITVGGKTITLPDPFLVMATQNPLEQEGTYPLPEAQIDRFLFKILVDYPSHDEEIGVLNSIESESKIKLSKKMTARKFSTIRKGVEEVKIGDDVKNYITRLVQTTRKKHKYILYGASPRASIGLMLASKAVAFGEGREYVQFEDVQKVYLAVLRHRIVLNYDAKTDEVKEDSILLELASQVLLTD